MADTPLFDEKTRRKLEQLMLWAPRVRAGALKGERRSVKRGTSIEFADYRNYSPGDDLRRLDWNIYARLERPLTKVFEDEEDLAVHLLLDASASMDWPPKGGEIEGAADAHKFTFARRLVAGLGYISLATNDRLTLIGLNQDREQFGPARGRSHGLALLRFVTSIKPRGVADLNAALTRYAQRAGQPGLCLLVSDMFSPGGYLDGVSALLSKGYEVALIHLLSPDEIDPPLAGDLRLIDVESGTAQEVTVDGALRDLYRQRVDDWRDNLRVECARRNVHYLPVSTGTPWEKVILYDLRRMGLIK
jgi:uncharacterized protein (DUF58 family)